MVRVLWNGRTRDALLSGLIVRYVERIRRSIPFRLEEAGQRGGGRQNSMSRAEGRRLASRLPEGAMVVALQAGGQEMSSEQFARWLEQLLSGGPGNLVFVLGGPDGLPEDVIRRASRSLSLSRMTLTHEMARVFFLEQLYRALTIIKGEKYHHGHVV